MTKTTYSILIAVVLLGFSFSVQAQKQYLLGSSTVKGQKVIRSEELLELIPQKPNRRFLGLPVYHYLGLYRASKVFYNPEPRRRKLALLTAEYKQLTEQMNNEGVNTLRSQKKVAKRILRAERYIRDGNFGMRILGESPVYFNESEVIRNAQKMQVYLQTNGFFEGQVRYSTDTIIGRIKTTYLIEEGTEARLNSIRYEISDTHMDSLANAAQKSSPLQAQTRYRGANFEAERIYLETLFRNNGYYGFTRQFTQFLVNDTLSMLPGKPYKPLDVLVRIAPPSPTTNHIRYTLGQLHFEVLPAASTSPIQSTKDTLENEGVRFVFSGIPYSPRILGSKLTLKQGDLYRLKNERETQRQLTLTDQFRFVNYAFDTSGTTLNGYFRATPLDKHQISADVGLNVIQLQQAPGPFANLSYKVRNIFGGLENLETNVRGGIEAVTGFSDARLYRSQEVSVNTSLIFPQWLLNKSIQNRVATYSPRTQLGFGYNYVNRPEFVRTNVKTALTYTLQPNNQTFYTLSLIDLNILNTPTERIRPEFQSLLDTLQAQGNNLFISFRKSFVSGIGFSYLHNTTNLFTTTTQQAHYFRVGIESGGTSLSLWPGQRQLVQKIFGDLDFFQYLRWEVDFRRYWPLNRRTVLVGRFHTGAVHSYGDNSVPPYEKYFFAGGANSVRGWLPRRLGPGGNPPLITASNFSIEAPGELLLEGNMELRGPLFRLGADINYALFVDVGNVWLLPSRGVESEANFSLSSFPSQLAVGTGFGVRADFSYFVMRFDFGTKVYDPALKRFVLDELQLRQLFNIRAPNFLNFNLGVGYPF
jgi:outer membrane protein assembly factor BamA